MDFCSFFADICLDCCYYCIDFCEDLYCYIDSCFFFQKLLHGLLRQWITLNYANIAACIWVDYADNAAWMLYIIRFADIVAWSVVDVFADMCCMECCRFLADIAASNAVVFGRHCCSCRISPRSAVLKRFQIFFSYQ